MENNELKKLMSGIAIVIDDALEKDGTSNNDSIGEIVGEIKEWEVPIYIENKIPPSDVTWNNLLQSANFVLLDWKLWEDGAQELEKIGIEKNIEFLKRAKSYFIPVFIFTNENLEDIKEAICPAVISENQSLEKSFIFLKDKNSLTGRNLLDSIRGWMKENASVYTLKVWEQAFYKAKTDLFSSMYEKSPDWPKIFWESYYKDGADPSSSIMHLINDSLLGRIETGLFEKEYLSSDVSTISLSPGEIKSVMMAASFIQGENLPKNEIRAGDLFKRERNKYWLNIRPDCDCIPGRNGQKAEDVELYCIEGKSMKPSDIKASYSNGHFNERISESIIFSAHSEKTIRFKFQKLQKAKFSEIKNKRVGRFIHPYITRIQQRYSSYLQRQGLPRIPENAIESDSEE